MQTTHTAVGSFRDPARAQIFRNTRGASQPMGYDSSPRPHGGLDPPSFTRMCRDGVIEVEPTLGFDFGGCTSRCR
eukprot:3414066-Amphidinium_carterae.1